MNPASDTLTSPSRATAASRPATFARSRARPRRRSTGARSADPRFRRHDRRPDRHRFSRLASTTCWRDCPPLDAAVSRRKTPRSQRPRGPGPSETRRGGARGHAAAAALGMAGAAIRRRLGRVAQAGRRGPARQQGQGPDQAGAGSGLSFHRRRWRENKPHYEEVARALFAGDAERFRGLDGRLARRRARPRPPAGRDGVRTTDLDAGVAG